jgi:oligopeptide transport system substrate-binding protein
VEALLTITDPARHLLRAGIALLASAVLVLGSVAPAIPVLTGPSALAAGRDDVRIVAGEPRSIDPARHGDVGSAAVVANLFETLTAIDPSLTLRPALAESWELEDEGRRVVFTLRPNLTFSDGSALVAEDVVRSWRRVVDPQRPSPLASLIADVRGVRALLAGRASDPATMGVRADGDRRVIVDLERPGGDLPTIVSSAPFAVVPRNAGAEISPDPATFVGSGAYVLAAIREGELELRANDRYWAGAPSIRTVRLLSDIGGRSPVDAFAAGELDYVPIGHWDAGWIAYDETLGPSLRAEPSLSVTYYGFDTTRPPFDDARVRRAFALAVDWRRLAALQAPGSITPATGMVPVGIPGRPEGDYVPPYDPDEARRLLADAGYPCGRGLEPIQFLTGGGGSDRAVIAMLEAELGVTVDYAWMAFGDYFTRLEAEPPQLWNLSWIADYPGPNDFLDVLLGTGSTANYGRWSSAAFDEAIEDAVSSADPDQAVDAYARALGIVRDEAPVVPLYYGASWALAREGLLGAADNGMGILRLAGLAWEEGQ